MYLTRFNRADGKIENHQHKTKEEAITHLKRFINDNSGMYRNVAVMDDDPSMRILCILPFHDEKAGRIINNGDIVRLRKEYSRLEERKDLYVVKNINDWSENIQIMCITSNMCLKPIETVKVEMIEPVLDAGE